MPKNSDAKLKAIKKYDQKAYDQITLRVPKGQKQIITDIAAKYNLSPNGYINRAIQTQIVIDSTPEDDPIE